MTPRTVYACGSSDYDQRPGTFKRGDQCRPPATAKGRQILGLGPTPTCSALPFAPGDTLENTSPMALAKKIRVMAINERAFTGEVLEGENTKDPITVYRAGWCLYRKVQPAPDITPEDLAAVADFATLNAMERTAPNIVKEIRALVAAGESREQIIARFCELGMSAQMMRNCAHAINAIRREAKA